MKTEIRIFQSYLRRQGHRVTKQRLDVARKVFSLHRHFTADELQYMLRKEGVSRATIYRTLSLMLEAGLVKEHNFGDRGKIYEHIIGHTSHFHLVCITCGRITEIERTEIEDALARAATSEGFQILEKDVVLFGFCSQCRQG